MPGLIKAVLVLLLVSMNSGVLAHDRLVDRPVLLEPGNLLPRAVAYDQHEMRLMLASVHASCIIVDQSFMLNLPGCA